MIPMKYKAIPVGKMWVVFEIESEQIVATFEKENHARRQAKMFNRGIAWNGWTPAFFLKTGYHSPAKVAGE